MFSWSIILRRCHNYIRVSRAPFNSARKTCLLPQVCRPLLWGRAFATKSHQDQSQQADGVQRPRFRGIASSGNDSTPPPDLVHKRSQRWHEKQVELQLWEQRFGRLFGTDVLLRDTVAPVSAEEVRWAEELLGDGDVQAVQKRWWAQPLSTRRLRRSPIILACLISSPRDTLTLIHHVLLPPFEVTMDCLLYLKKGHWPDIVSDPFYLGLFHETLASKQKSYEWPRIQMEHRHLNLFLEYLDGVSIEEARRLLAEFNATYEQLSTNTLLTFIDFFITARDVESTLEAFRCIAPDTITDSPPKVLARCTKLLKLDFVRKDGPAQNFAILPRLLEIGIKPNTIIHNVVMKNAFKAGMSGVGWDLYRYMQEQGLSTNARTYLALLQDALDRRSITQIKELFSIIHQHSDLATNPHIVIYTLNIIRVIYIKEKRLSESEAFSRMLSVYTRGFNATPLREIGVISDADVTAENASLPDPDPRTLAFTIWSYVMVQRNKDVVLALWTRIQTLLEGLDPMIMAIWREDIIYNGLIVFFSRSVQTLPDCLRVVEYMLSTNHCEPTAKTWGIVLLAFLKWGDQSTAEKIRGMMEVRGVTLDEYTRGLLQQLPPEQSEHRDPEAEALLNQLVSASEPAKEGELPEVLRSSENSGYYFDRSEKERKGIDGEKGFEVQQLADEVTETLPDPVSENIVKDFELPTKRHRAENETVPNSALPE